jgi:Big-like domain-containing protein/PKD domain-containing protein
VTPVSVTLPAAADDQPIVDVRVITTDAPGPDEWVGVDDIAVTGTDIEQDVAPAVLDITPSDGAADVALGADLSVTFSEPVDVSGDWSTIDCATSGSHAVAVSGGPSTFTLDPTTDFASDEACTWTIVGAQVSDQDTNDPPDTMAADHTVRFTTETVHVDAPPTVDAGGPYSVTEGGTVAVSAVGSDPDGDALTYAWDLDGDGAFETAGPSPTFSAGGLQAPSTRTIQVRVTDPDGLEATDSAEVDVTWAFRGFRPPLAGDGTDVANAGSTVVVKFSLAGNQGRNLFKPGYPASTAFTCGAEPPSDATEPAVGLNPLVYDPLRDEYVFEWKTDKSWAGTCRSFVLGLRDGTTHAFAIRLT